MATTAGLTYTYDGDGKRVKKAAASPSQYDRLYWYAPNGLVLAESDLSGNIISEYIFFGGTRIARRDVASGNVYYHVSDRLGNANIVTNASGTVVEESDFYPFGVERPIINTLDNNHKFTGHERDAESGLDHTEFRKYSCATGRWLSPDSVRGKANNPQSWNRYAYVQNNPVNAMDPNGAEMYSCLEIYDNYLERVVSISCNCLTCQQAGNGPDPFGDIDPRDSDAAVALRWYWSMRYFKEVVEELSTMRFDTECEGEFALLGTSSDEVRDRASKAWVRDGIGAGILIADLYANAASQTLQERRYDLFGGRTVGGDFAANSTTTAISEPGGYSIFINVASNNFPTQKLSIYGMALHEVLHLATGLTDPDIQSRLGLLQHDAAGNPIGSINISRHLYQKCFGLPNDD